MKKIAVFLLIFIVISCLLCACAVTELPQETTPEVTTFEDPVPVITTPKEEEPVQTTSAEKTTYPMATVPGASVSSNQTLPITTPPVTTTPSTTVTTTETPIVIPSGYSEGLRFISNGDGTCFLNGKGSCTDTVIRVPNVSPEGDRVVAVGENAFSGDKKLEKIELSEGVKEIGKSAFRNCENLTEISLPSTLTDIGEGAFVQCYSLKAIDIPEGIKEIRADVFYNCFDLVSVSLPQSLRKISTNAFYNCSALLAIEIPNGVTHIGDRAFNNCMKLETLDLPDSLIEIADEAFIGCDSLLHIDFPEGLISIGTQAFFGVSGLRELTLPESLCYIGKYAFDSPGKDIFTLYEGAYYIGSRDNPYFAMVQRESMWVESITIHPDTEIIGAEIFDACIAPDTLIIPDKVRSICFRAFAGCGGLKTVQLGSGLEYIEKSAFANCGADTIVIPANVKAIGERAFSGAKMTSAVVYGAVELDEYAFSSTSLRTITLSREIGALPYRVFHYSSYLHDIVFLGTKAEWEALPKADGWDSGMGGKSEDGSFCEFYTIHCTDGDIVAPQNPW